MAQVDVYFAKYSKSILISHIYEPPPTLMHVIAKMPRHLRNGVGYFFHTPLFLAESNSI